LLLGTLHTHDIDHAVIQSLHATAVGLLLWAQWAGDISQEWQLPSATAAWHSAANASSVVLSADVGSSLQTCSVLKKFCKSALS